MQVIRFTISDLFLGELKKYSMTPYIHDNIETGIRLYREMKKFYDTAEKVMPTEHYLYLLLDDILVVGYRYLYIYPENKMGELFSIAIDPAYRKKGYAKILIQIAIEFMRKKDIKKIKVPLIKTETDFCILKKHYDLLKEENTDMDFYITFQAD